MLQVFRDPAGFAHGVLTLENDVILNYKVSGYYAAAHEGGIRWDDPDIGIAWPVAAGAITLSEKDQLLPLLKDFDSPFPYDGAPLAPLFAPEVF
jgi:dTDP-4-dehydrorhamnose 3,5-epimerase